jgi:L-threonylcarbamoyladenylate synthase
MAPSLDDAARAIRRGELVVVPTDTLVGLAAAARNRRAVDRLRDAKGRPERLPLSIAVSSIEELEPYARLAPGGRRFVRRHLPGPFTILARPSPEARRTLDPRVAAGPAIGLRVPDHPVVRELCRRVGPITATSANLHGEPPARTVEDARRAFGRSVRVYLPARPRPSGVPSTLVDLTGAVPRRVPRR